MDEVKRLYELTFAESDDPEHQPQGKVRKLLTDTQVERLRRNGVERPNARLQSIEPVENEDEG